MEGIPKNPLSTTTASLAEDPELVADFVSESREHLGNIESVLLVLEQNPQDPEPVHALFRAFHTIKGLAGFLEFSSIQSVAHEVETVLDRVRESKLRVSPAIIDVILQSGDYLNREIGSVEAGKQPAHCLDLLAKIRSVCEAPPVALAEPVVAGLRAIEEALGAAEKDANFEGDHRNAADMRGVKVDTAKLDYLVEMTGEMVIALSLVRHNPAITVSADAQLLRDMAQLARISEQVQKSALSMRMAPIRSLFQKMARLVRDLSRKAGKQVELETSGEDTELDRNMLEELTDPLMHMIRNAVDHGIGSAEERVAASKPPGGRILLRAYYQAGHIVIEVGDDGRGLDRHRIISTAVERGRIGSADGLSDAEVFELIFEPGFSTAERVTDMSGRGVGMDVVKRQIQKLRGVVEIQSSPGRGTKFFLKLPLTLALIDGFIVRVGTERYIVPVFAIREMIRPVREAITTVQSRAEMVVVRDGLVPLIRLHRVFDVAAGSEDPCESLLIVCESNGKRFCLMADEFTGKQEVVIKSMGEAFKSISPIAGSAILGDGRVGLILDTAAIFRDWANA